MPKKSFDFRPMSATGRLKVDSKYGPPRLIADILMDDQGNQLQVYLFDEFGLAMDPLMWTKADSKCCNGKGFNWSSPENNEERQMAPCHCAIARYQRTRNNIEDRLVACVDRGGDPARELEKIHKENGSEIHVEQVVAPESVITT